MYLFWVALLLGIVEGLTEFLPISSTGHLIVTSDLLEFGGKRKEVFTVFIQLGAILAVVWEYRERLARVVLQAPRQARERRFVIALGVAFLPAAVLGLLVHDYISEHLFSTATVGWALIAGALLIFLVEALPLRVRTREAESVTWTQAVLIGAAQCLALW